MVIIYRCLTFKGTQIRGVNNQIIGLVLRGSDGDPPPVWSRTKLLQKEIPEGFPR